MGRSSEASAVKAALRAFDAVELFGASHIPWHMRAAMSYTNVGTSGTTPLAYGNYLGVNILPFACLPVWLDLPNMRYGAAVSTQVIAILMAVSPRERTGSRDVGVGAKIHTCIIGMGGGGGLAVGQDGRLDQPPGLWGGPSWSGALVVAGTDLWALAGTVDSGMRPACQA